MITATGATTPFVLTLPAAYGLAASTTSTGTSTGTSTTAATPQDVLDVKVPLPGGTLEVEGGDRLALRDLFDAGTKAWDTVSRYRLALRDDPSTPGGGRLLLRGEDVTDRTDFTPLEFNELQFLAGSAGARTDLVVVARGGTDSLPADSAPVAVTLASTGTRSLAVAPALRNEAGADEAAFLSVVRDSSVYKGYGTTRPALTTVGNLTAEAGDVLAVRDLFDAGTTAWRDIALYRVAIREDPDSPGGARLMLGDQDVTDRTDFTPDEFNGLRLVAGADGARTELVAVARRGTADGAGGLTNIVDSPAVAITAAVTGTRSLNAVEALRTEPGPDEARFLSVARDSTVYTGFGTTRPAVTTAGNVTTEAGDALALRDLFDAGTKAWDTVALYRVAIREDPDSPGGARLMLGEEDVTARTDFTPDEFNQLRFVAGADGAKTDILVVARSGTADGAGGLSNIVDSPAAAITAAATGTRSLNAVEALRTEPGAEEARFLSVARESTVYAGYGATRPAVTTVGNVTTEAGDELALRDLFDAGSKAWDTVALYRVALREDPDSPGGARLMLGDEDVTSRTDFTPEEFNGLRFLAGADGAKTEMVVVARAGTADGAGGLKNIVDSPAVAITAAATGTRSLNTAAALRTTPGADEAAFLAVARDATVYTGYGTTRPALTTAGSFDAEAGDAFGLRDLFDAGSKAWDTVALYRVALRDDPDTPGGGRLVLDDADVTDRTDFTPLEFNRLRFVAGADGAKTEMVVVARSGTADGAGGLTGIVDSPAVAITATTTGTRSVNAAAALRTTPGADESAFLNVIRDAAILTGTASTRPTVTTTAPAASLAVSPDLLAARAGAFRTLGPATAAARDAASLYAGALGAFRSSVTTTASRDAAALALLLGGGNTAATVTPNLRAATTLAVRA